MMVLRRLLLLFLIAGMILSTGTTLQASEKKKNSAITWLSFSEAVAKAKKENKMVVVDFYTDWCGWCKVMDEKTYGHKDVIDFASKKLVMSKVDAESDEKTSFKGQELTYRQLARAFGVRGYPTTVFISPKGEFLTSVSGFIPADQFLPILEFLSERHYENMTFEKFMEKRNSDDKTE
ncbi:MAG: thioredoxin fold domain-containing protein [candidate division KSB1 bacterium]|nr:thioredoxin fold domain-containing protein [candidate division KSB1 bacterium]